MMRRDGFTLVEVMVVLLILAIGIIPLAVVQSQSRREVSSVDRQARSMILAQQQLEFMKGMAWNMVLAAPDTGHVDGLFWRADVDSLDIGLRRMRVMVVDFSRSPPDTLHMASLRAARSRWDIGAGP